MREIRDLFKERRQKIHSYWGCCAYCGSSNNVTLDHVKPKSKGGTENTSNLISCCPECNLSKGHLDWEVWYQSQSFFEFNKYLRIRDWVRKSP